MGVVIPLRVNASSCARLTAPIRVTQQLAESDGKIPLFADHAAEAFPLDDAVSVGTDLTHDWRNVFGKPSRRDVLT